MPALYTTRQGETVDLACSRHYGSTEGVTELVLDANPGLAALGPVLPFATAIVMPDAAAQGEQQRLVSLWE